MYDECILQRRLWIAAMVAFSLLALGVAMFASVQDRSRTLVDQQGRLAAATLLLEQYVERHLAAGERFADAAIKRAASWDFVDPAQGAEMQAFLHGRVESNQAFTSAWILDASGRTVVENWAFPAISTGIYTGRDYFKAHAGRDSDVFIGPMGTGTITAQQRFVLSKPIRAQDGELRGVVAIGMREGYLSDVYARSKISDGSSLQVVRRGGDVLVAWGSAQVGSGLRNGVSAQRDMARFPMTIKAFTAQSNLLADWRIRAWEKLLAAFVAIAGFVWLGQFGLRSVRREHVARKRSHTAYRMLARRAVKLKESVGREQKSRVEIDYLLSELNHRVKNILAIVAAIVSQSVRGRGVDPAIVRDIHARLQALAASNDTLVHADAEGGSLEEIVSKSLAPFVADGRKVDRLRIHGENVRVDGHAVVPLRLMLHELATNAVKYGALSVSDGVIDIEWELSRGPTRRGLRLIWSEHGGPAVQPSGRSDSGSQLMREVLAAQWNARTSIEYRASGVNCVIEFDLDPADAAATA